MPIGATLRLTYSSTTGDDVVLNFKYVDTTLPNLGVAVKAFSDGLVTGKNLFESPMPSIIALTKAETYQTVTQNIPLS